MRIQKLIGIVFIFLGLLILNIQPISAEEKVSLKLNRTMGTDLGNGKIQGKFTATGTGTSDIIFLRLFFNQTEVYNASSNSLIFAFNTGDYSLGIWNISLVGFTAENEQHTTSIMVEFISEEVGTYIAIAAGGIVLIVLSIRIVRFIQNRKGKKKELKGVKKEIKIEIDKDFA